MPSLFRHTEKVDIKSSPLFPFSPSAINHFQSLPFPLPPLFSVLHPAPRHTTFFAARGDDAFSDGGSSLPGSAVASKVGEGYRVARKVSWQMIGIFYPHIPTFLQLHF